MLSTSALKCGDGVVRFIVCEIFDEELSGAGNSGRLGCLTKSYFDQLVRTGICRIMVSCVLLCQVEFGVRGEFWWYW